MPDCDLSNSQVNGECGVWSDLSFGGVRPGTSWTDDAIKGFNVQQYNWQGSVSLQHELRPGVALNVGYFRTSLRQLPDHGQRGADGGRLRRVLHHAAFGAVPGWGHDAGRR